MKKTFCFLAILSLFVSCSLSLQKGGVSSVNLPNNYHTDEYPENPSTIESMRMSSNLLSPFSDDSCKIDSNCIIKFIDVQHLKNLVETNNKTTIIHFWSSVYESQVPQISEWNQLKKEFSSNFLIVCTDIGTTEQINLLRKYFTAKGFNDTLFILYKQISGIMQVVSDAKIGFANTVKMINNIDTAFHGFGQLPYTVLINRKDEILFRSSGEIDISELSKNYNENSNTKVGTAFSAFKESNFTQKNITSNKLVFLSPIAPELELDSLATFDENIYVPDSVCKVITITPAEIRQIIDKNHDQKILLHIFTLFNPIATLGIQDILQFVPETDKYIIMLICADMNTGGQINILRKYLFQKGITIPIYLIDNKFDSENDLENFIQMEHLIKFVKTFDSTYTDVMLPYTAIIDENQKIIYSRKLDLVFNKCSLHFDSLEVKETKDKCNGFMKMEVEKIKTILK
ncbi:MAG: hypothetical protein A2X64_02225 [Ignavibacteria bacterium GWF2_33_9]|nr:MAG: hypothetical protein A2X64_02225 [Ignavibacteria bacterium GWF2_33_9]